MRGELLPQFASLYIYICICTYLFIYLQKRTLSGPHFSTFLRMQCFCYIMFDRLCSYTCCDGITKKSTQIVRLPQRLPKNVQTGMKIPREKEGGKKNIMCIYIWLPLGREVAKEKKITIFFALSPLLALLCTCPLPDGLAFFLVVLLYASMIWKVNK